MRAIYPDLHYRIEEIFASHENVAMAWTAVGTHHDTLWSLIPATEKKITWQGIHLLSIKNGKIVAIRAVADTLAQLQ